MESLDSKRATLSRASVQSLSMRSMSELIGGAEVIEKRRLRSVSVPVSLNAFKRCVLCLVDEGAKIAVSQDRRRLGSPLIVITPLQLEDEVEACPHHQSTDRSQSLPSLARGRNHAVAARVMKKTMLQRNKRAGEANASFQEEKGHIAELRNEREPSTSLMSLEDIAEVEELKFATPAEEQMKEGASEEEDIMENCSLMEYPTTITAESPLAALLKIQELSNEFEAKIGGLVTVASSDTPIAEGEQEGTYELSIKWALPVLNFENSSAKPDEVASWLLKSVPPNDCDAMGSRKGLFMDVDRSVLRRILKDAISRQVLPK